MKSINTLADDFGKIIGDNYKELLKLKANYLNKNVIRKINVTMSNICENEVACLVSEQLGKKYRYIVDAYLSFYDKKEKKYRQYRPDIIIIKPNNGINEIVGIIEVKAQMGYCGELKPNDYQTKLDNLRENYKINFSKKEYEQICENKDIENYYKELGVTEDHKSIDYIINRNKVHIFIVNILASNHVSNVEKTINNFENDKSCSKIHFYSLYGGKNVWYDNLKSDKLYELSDSDNKEINKVDHGFKKFVEDLNEYIDK